MDRILCIVHQTCFVHWLRMDDAEHKHDSSSTIGSAVQALMNIYEVLRGVWINVFLVR